MDKEYILKEIEKTAKEHNGIPLGWRKFESETGIRYSDWYGKYWAKWSDALVEAGYTPNKMRSAYDETFLFDQIIDLIREIGKFPTAGELRLRNHNNDDFPNPKTIKKRLGSPSEVASKLLSFCEGKPQHSDIITICRERIDATPQESPETSPRVSNVDFGYVYLMKSGRFYKIGHSDNVERRNYDLGIKLPEAINIIHKITTDDPDGIEHYWHDRFEHKRKQGEWFDLSGEDISAFKKRKFM